tara:strand:+ start:1171 stop:1482 length:312 start_codon:yes stop_codon:yes gene_type:complete
VDQLANNKILPSSSIWVAILLNFLPGLGTGYIYQRRWKAYWITNIASAIWIFIVITRELGLDPSDPAIRQNDPIGFLGICSISIFTSIESWISINKARKINGI